jgi:TetR/AcrR family transcriptional regulator
VRQRNASAIQRSPTNTLLRRRQKDQRDPELMKALILSAARDEFVEFGLSGARVDRIAARTQASKNLIYYYYGDKERLYLAVLEDVYQGMRADQDAISLEGDPAAAMQRLVERTFDHFVQTPSLTRLMSVENIYFARHLKSSKIVRGIYKPLFDNLRLLLKRGQDQGVFRSDVDPFELYITISGISYFYLSNRYTLSWILDDDLSSPTRLEKRRIHVVEVVRGYLRP